MSAADDADAMLADLGFVPIGDDVAEAQETGAAVMAEIIARQGVRAPAEFAELTSIEVDPPFGVVRAGDTIVVAHNATNYQSDPDWRARLTALGVNVIVAPIQLVAIHRKEVQP